MIRRYVARGAIEAERGLDALETLVLFPIQRSSHLDLLPRIWALRHNLTA